jgi:hypothetical protein
MQQPQSVLDAPLLFATAKAYNDETPFDSPLAHPVQCSAGDSSALGLMHLEQHQQQKLNYF